MDCECDDMIDKLPVQLPLLVPLAAGLLGLLALMFIGKVPLGYNLRNLAVRWRISALTALAFTLVVALLTVLLAFVNGMYHITDSSGRPGNVIVLSDGATDELFSNLGYSDTNNIDDLLGADGRAALERDAAGRPLVSRELYVVINQPMPAKPGEKPRRSFIQVRGLED
ncbi:MAG TPA: hypothetical protein VFA26_20560, partial [Gemmataceae bacterium]|nr:hypothetical protein [Gemmataceae bacterium]